MAQIEATILDSYTTNEGDKVYLYEDGGEFWVAFIYADQSPQFIRTGERKEAEDLFKGAREQADKRGNLAAWMHG